jgi:hypothetical protein
VRLFSARFAIGVFSPKRCGEKPWAIRAGACTAGRLLPAMRELFPILLFFCLASAAVAGPCPAAAAGKPVAIPTEASAIAAAKDAWRSIHEKTWYDAHFAPSSIARFEPYRAILQGNEWHVISVSADYSRDDAPEALVCEVDEAVSARASKSPRI